MSAIEAPAADENFVRGLKGEVEGHRALAGLLDRRLRRDRTAEGVHELQVADHEQDDQDHVHQHGIDEGSRVTA